MQKEAKKSYSYSEFLQFIKGRCIIEMRRDNGRTRRYIDYKLLPLRLAVFAEHLGISHRELYYRLDNFGEVVGDHYIMMMGKGIYDYPSQPFEREVDGKIIPVKPFFISSPRKIVDPRDKEYYTDAEGNQLWMENYKPKTVETANKNKSYIRQRT